MFGHIKILDGYQPTITPSGTKTPPRGGSNVQPPSYSNKEPAPKKGKVTIYPLVIKDIADRVEYGRKKHGGYLESENGRDALVDAYQEALDLVFYLRQLIEERNNE